MRTPVTVAALLAFFVMPPVPAQADVVAATGAATFTGTARMPMFPCEPTEPGGDVCEGTWNGTLTGALEGRHTTTDGREVPWGVVIDAPGTASLRYAAPNDATDCAAGLVQGHATFSGGGGNNQAWGAYVNSTPIPAPIVGTKLSLHFQWPRAGTTGPVVVTGMSIEIQVYGVGWVTVIDDSQSVSAAAGGATFMPDEPVDCVSHPPAALEGTMEGTLSGIAVAP